MSNQSACSAVFTTGTTGRALPRTLAQGLLFLAICLPVAGASAQTRLVLNRILFDPQPLTTAPAAPAQEPSTTSTENLLPAPLAAAADLSAESIDLYLQNIADEELDNGPFAPELMEQFLALGEAYQQQGDHEAALAAFDKADHISRINSGLYSPQQFAIIRNMIASHLAKGEVAEANTKQQYLLFLNRQYYGDESLEVVPALETLGNWNLDAFRSILNQHNTSNFTLGVNSNLQMNGPSPRMLAFGNLFLAQNNYYQAIVNLVGHRQYTDPKLLELERKLTEAVFLAANRDGIMDNPDFYLGKRSMYTGTRISRNMRGFSMQFINGRNSYQRMRIYQEVTPGTDPVAIAETIIAMGDWHLLFDRQISALEHYREAHAYMKARGVPDATITAMLTPALPQKLPAFTPLPHSREKFGIPADAMVEYDGHIDLSFRISRFGNVSNVEVLERSGEVDPDVERRLKKLLRSSPFRPRFTEGDLAKSDQVMVRYNFAQID